MNNNDVNNDVVNNVNPGVIPGQPVPTPVPGVTNANPGVVPGAPVVSAIPVSAPVPQPAPQPNPEVSVIPQPAPVSSAPGPVGLGTAINSTNPLPEPVPSVIPTGAPEPANNLMPPINQAPSQNNLGQAVNNLNQVSGVDTNNQVNPQSVMQPNMGAQSSEIAGSDDEELLKAFIGANYDKITTKPFNFAGLFFSYFYMFYRKMFLYGLLVAFVLSTVYIFTNNYFILLVGWILIGLFINKIYVPFAKGKIEKIKKNNPDKSVDELKGICATKGGTSVGQIFLGFLAAVAVSVVLPIVLLFVGYNAKVNSSFNSVFGNTDGSKTLVEDVTVDGSSCFNSKCTVTITDVDGLPTVYAIEKNSDFFTNLSDYNDYIKVDIYYGKSSNAKVIVDYKIYVKSTNEDISSVTTEKALREKLGLFSEGTHTEKLKLVEVGTIGMGFEGDDTYTYRDCTFTDGNNNEYEMKYIISDNDKVELTEGNEYEVTFEVAKGTFEYEYTIKTIK